MAQPAVEWTDVALSDLDQIAEHIARDSPTYSAAFVRRALTSARSTSTFPLSGHVVPEFEDVAIREVPIYPYRLIYKVTPDVIYILALIHGARDLEALWRRENRAR